MSAPDGFRRDPLEPELAAYAEDDGEENLVVVNSEQPRKNALNALRAIMRRRFGWLPLVHFAAEPARRAFCEQAAAAVCAATLAVGTGASLATDDELARRAVGALPPAASQSARFLAIVELQPAPRPTGTPSQEPTTKGPTKSSTPIGEEEPTPSPTRPPAASPDGPPATTPTPTLDQSPGPAPETTPPTPSPSTGDLDVQADVGPIKVTLRLDLGLKGVLAN